MNNNTNNTNTKTKSVSAKTGGAKKIINIEKQSTNAPKTIKPKPNNSTIGTPTIKPKLNNTTAKSPQTINAKTNISSSSGINNNTTIKTKQTNELTNNNNAPSKTTNNVVAPKTKIPAKKSTNISTNLQIDKDKMHFLEKYNMYVEKNKDGEYENDDYYFIVINSHDNNNKNYKSKKYDLQINYKVFYDYEDDSVKIKFNENAKQKYVEFISFNTAAEYYFYEDDDKYKDKNCDLELNTSATVNSKYKDGDYDDSDEEITDYEVDFMSIFVFKK